jgi:beta-alanine--pyruvate transaminase
VFGVQPDMITFAKGVTSGTVPMGGVICTPEIHDTFMTGPQGAVELFHGYTYSAHPLACAAGIATLQLYKDEALFERAASMAPKLAAAVHSLKGEKHVIDLRAFGLVGAVELEARAGAPGARAFEAFLKAYDKGVVLRSAADNIVISPAFIIEDAQIDRIISVLRDVINSID